MSTMVQPTKNRRPRRQFDDEFKAGAVRLVLDEGQTVGRVARDLDLTAQHCATGSIAPVRIGRQDGPA